MKLRQMTLLLVSLSLSAAASAQQSKSDESLEFRPHWSLSVQGGVAHTRGEQSFQELLSPAAQVGVTYRFHHAMGVRFGLGGWQGRGGVLTSDGYQGYAYRFGQLNADYVLDLAGLFGGYSHSRVVSPYVFAGIGAGYGFDNDEASAYKDALEYYWDSRFLAPVGRAGLGVDFRLGEVMSLGLEGNANVLSDRFNSKKAENADWQFNLLLGLKFNLGKTTRPSQAYADRLAAEEAAAALAAAEQQAEAERLAAEKAAREAAERAEAERIAAEKAAKEAAEKAAAERAALAAENSDNVFFTINSAYIRSTEAAKVVQLAAWMKENPDFTVTLVGYADKKTGNASINETLSRRRAIAVRDALVKEGIEPSRITTTHMGDKEQPFAENAKNRVVVCTLE